MKAGQTHHDATRHAPRPAHQAGNSGHPPISVQFIKSPRTEKPGFDPCAAPLSVIPDIVYRESILVFFSDGSPLTTCGDDSHFSLTLHPSLVLAAQRHHQLGGMRIRIEPLKGETRGDRLESVRRECQTGRPCFPDLAFHTRTRSSRPRMREWESRPFRSFLRKQESRGVLFFLDARFQGHDGGAASHVWL